MDRKNFDLIWKQYSLKSSTICSWTPLMSLDGTTSNWSNIIFAETSSKHDNITLFAMDSTIDHVWHHCLVSLSEKPSGWNQDFCRSRFNWASISWHRKTRSRVETTVYRRARLRPLPKVWRPSLFSLSQAHTVLHISSRNCHTQGWVPQPTYWTSSTNLLALSRTSSHATSSTLPPTRKLLTTAPSPCKIAHPPSR